MDQLDKIGHQERWRVAILTPTKYETVEDAVVAASCVDQAEGSAMIIRETVRLRIVA